jgi:hypothetical protein
MQSAPACTALVFLLTAANLSGWKMPILLWENAWRRFQNAKYRLQDAWRRKFYAWRRFQDA